MSQYFCKHNHKEAFPENRTSDAAVNYGCHQLGLFPKSKYKVRQTVLKYRLTFCDSCQVRQSQRAPE